MSQQIIPIEVIKQDTGKCVGSMEEGQYGWTRIMADKDGVAFALLHEPVKEHQSETTPHFIQLEHSGGVKVRLMNQLVERADYKIGKSKFVRLATTLEV
jgi:hypothetical protein